ncbi:MAG: hypothetical protein ACRCXL_12135 [Dermatophilaceae bacterium]
MESARTALTDGQLEVARVFFDLRAARGFVLAGGAALAQDLTSRPTHDLDFFTSEAAGSVDEATEQLVRAARERG